MELPGFATGRLVRYLPFTGIGSRVTPRNKLIILRNTCASLARLGYTLRSGGAPGADQWCEAGADHFNGSKEIYIPWRGFEGIQDGLIVTDPRCEEIAGAFHPGWANCKPGARKLHSRNVPQVLGETLDVPSRFVLCWTPDGSEGETTFKTGGTGQALRIAAHYNVPIFNVFHDDAIDRLIIFLGVSK